LLELASQLSRCGSLSIRTRNSSGCASRRFSKSQAEAPAVVYTCRSLSATSIVHRNTLQLSLRNRSTDIEDRQIAVRCHRQDRTNCATPLVSRLAALRIRTSLCPQYLELVQVVSEPFVFLTNAIGPHQMISRGRWSSTYFVVIGGVRTVFRKGSIHS
jgi:hypothetical protein